MVRGFDIITCKDKFPRDFLNSYATKINDPCKYIKLKITPYDEIFGRPVAYI